jgi:hypothetical protein
MTTSHIPSPDAASGVDAALLAVEPTEEISK